MDCDKEFPEVSFKVVRLFDKSSNETINLENEFKVLNDDTIDDVINKIALFYNLEPFGFCIFQNSGSLIYDFKFDKETKLLNFNPFNGFDEFVLNDGYSPLVIENSTFDYTNFKLEEIHNKCLYDTKMESEVFVVYIDDLIKYCSQSDYMDNTLNFVRGFLSQYFKTFVIDLYKNDVKTKMSNSEDYVSNAKNKNKMRNEIENQYLNNSLNFQDCILLSVVVTVKEQSKNNFIDLDKVFNAIELSETFPFVRYKSSNKKERRFKVVDGITDFILKEKLESWIMVIKDELGNAKPKNEIKTLVVKMRSHEDNYSDVVIYQNGKIEIFCYWSSEIKASVSNIENEIKNLSSLITVINIHNYNLDDIPVEDSLKKFIIPSYEDLKENFINGKESDVVVSSSKIIKNFKCDTNINFELLNNYVENDFYGICDVVYRNNIRLHLNVNDFPTSYYLKPWELFIQYKQISDYYQEKNINQFINYAIKYGIRVTTSPEVQKDLSEKISKKFMIPFEESLKYVTEAVSSHSSYIMPNVTLDYAVNKGIKLPGIEVKINRSQSDINEYFYTINGNLNLFYVSKINNFIIKLLSSYLGKLKGDEEEIVVIDESTIVPDVYGEEVEFDDYVDDDINLDEYYYEEETTEFMDDIYVDDDYTDKVVPNDEIPLDTNSKKVISNFKIIEPKTITKKNMTKLNRLVEINPEMFGPDTKYGRSCQNKVQPAVMTAKEKQSNLNSINTKIDALQSEINAKGESNELTTKLMHLKYNKRAIENGMTFMGNYYSCPSIWCATCNKFIPFYEIADSKKEVCPYCKNKIQVLINYDPLSGNAPNDYYPGFKTNAQGVYAPCCFVKQKYNWNKIKPELIERSEIVSMDEDLKGEKDTNYILKKDKIYLPENRVGHIPDIIASLFDFKNAQCKSSENEIINTLTNPSINCYLRIGVKNDRQSFLNAIVTAIPDLKNVDSMLEKTFEYLTLEKFMTLKNGSLRNIFKNENNNTDNNAFNNFKEYLSDINNIVDERLVWDLYSSESVIYDPINIVIIEMQVYNGNLTNPLWVCPVGYNSNIYSSKRKTFVLLKYENNYEIIVKSSFFNGSKVLSYLFNKDDEIVDYFMTVIQNNCKNINLYQDENAFMGNTKEPFSAEEIIIEISKIKDDIQRNKFVIDRQIISSYNTIEYLVTKNNLKIPVNLYSGPILGLFEVDYDSVSLLSYENTIQMCLELASLTNIPIVPMLNAIDTKGDAFGIIVNSSNFIETLKTKDYDNSYSSATNSDYYKNLVNTNNILSLDVKQDDKREIFSKNKIFEDETLERLKFEISNFLNTKEELKEIIKSTIENNDIKILYNVLLTIIIENDLVYSANEVDLNNYKNNTTRTICFNTSVQTNDPHCHYENEKNKLIIPFKNLVTGKENNLNHYVMIISTDLIQNPIKRNEILDNKMSIFSQHNTIIKSVKNERLFKSYEKYDLNDILNEIYLTDNSILNNNNNLYSIKNPIKLTSEQSRKITTVISNVDTTKKIITFKDDNIVLKETKPAVKEKVKPKPVIKIKNDIQEKVTVENDSVKLDEKERDDEDINVIQENGDSVEDVVKDTDEDAVRDLQEVSPVEETVAIEKETPFVVDEMPTRKPIVIIKRPLPDTPPEASVSVPVVPPRKPKISIKKPLPDTPPEASVSVPVVPPRKPKISIKKPLPDTSEASVSVSLEKEKEKMEKEEKEKEEMEEEKMEEEEMEEEEMEEKESINEENEDTMVSMNNMPLKRTKIIQSNESQSIKPKPKAFIKKPVVKIKLNSNVGGII
jgi:hypothetical protein